MLRKPGIGEQILLLIIAICVIFKFSNASIASIFSCLLIVIYFGYHYYEKTYWKRMGVPGPPGNFLFGNTLQLYEGFDKFDFENRKKYGNTYGSYVLGGPDLVTFDLDILRQVLIKDPNKFADVIFFDFLKSPYEWKRMRNLIHPKFATIKLQEFMPLFNRAAVELCDNIEIFARNSNKIPLRETFARHAWNSFAPPQVYNMGDSIYDKEESKILKQFREIFTAPWLFHPIILLQYLFPNFESLIRNLTKSQMMIQSMRDFLLGVLKNNPDIEDDNPDDVVQLILANMLKPEHEQHGHNKEDMNHKNNINKNLPKIDQGIANFEKISQFFVSVLSGQDATAYAMQMIIYVLAKMPEIQNKIREEIFQVLGDRQEVDFDDIPNLAYLYQVVQETLRMYPTNPRTNRLCTAPVTIKGVPFRPGCVFSVPIYAMHHNEEYYPDPFTFDPDRWLPEEKAKRDPLTFLPFGYGPHSCIGNRFAEFQIRVTLVHLLMNFEFVPVPGSSDLPLKLNTRGLVRPYEKLYILAKKISVFM